MNQETFLKLQQAFATASTPKEAADNIERLIGVKNIILFADKPARQIQQEVIDRLVALLYASNAMEPPIVIS